MPAVFGRRASVWPRTSSSAEGEQQPAFEYRILVQKYTNEQLIYWHFSDKYAIIFERTILPNGRWFMPQQPDPADRGRDEDLAWLDRDPMTAEEREASLDRLCEEDAPPGEEEDDEDFEPFTAAELAEIAEAAADELLAVTAATTGRRGPGQPGSARVFPGESASPAAGFGPGMALDLEPGGAGLAVAADAAAADDGLAGVSEGELVGLLCAWDRVEAHAAARKLAVIAELARRNPGPRASHPRLSVPRGDR
jgi:hypothetical protein